MKIIAAIIISLFLSVTEACECTIKAGDHVSPIINPMLDEDGKSIFLYWHCGNVKSISGKCGEWMVSIKTCTGKRIKCNYSYLKILNSQKKNESNN